MSIAPFKTFTYSKSGTKRKKIVDTPRYKYRNKENEDSYRSDTYRGIFITADGLGGYDGAKEASEHATLHLYKRLVKLHNRMKNRLIEESDVKSSIEEYVNKTNNCITTWSNNVEHLHNCGTTIDAIFINQDKIYGAHVGDGSVYKINTEDKIIKPITSNNPDKNHIKELSDLENFLVNFDRVSYALGREVISTQIYSEVISDSDIILMTTDGLTKKVHPDEILESFSNKSFTEGVQMLKKYCRKPVMLRPIIAGLKKYKITPEEVFMDDTTFIAIKRNEQYGK